jgi:RHH-type transcriptional regulator, rel operon repressor / antitoxin RelB
MAARNPVIKEMLTVRIRKSVRDKLLSLAEATGRSQTYLVEEALETFCDLNVWQISAIYEGISALDEGRITSHEDLKTQWERKREDHMG